MSKRKSSKTSVSPVPAGKPGQQRWSDQYPPSKPFVERRFAQHIAGDMSADKLVTKPKGR